MVGVDSLPAQNVHDFLIGLVVAEHDDVLAIPDAEEEEAYCFFELSFVLPKIGDVIAQSYPLVPKPQRNLATAGLGSLLIELRFHSNALSPVTACPRIKVWMSCVPS